MLLDAYKDKDGGWYYHIGNKRKHDDEMMEGTDEGEASEKHSASDGDAHEVVGHFGCLQFDKPLLCSMAGTVER